MGAPITWLPPVGEGAGVGVSGTKAGPVAAGGTVAIAVVSYETKK